MSDWSKAGWGLADAKERQIRELESELIEAKATLSEMFEALSEVEDALDEIFDRHIPEDRFPARALEVSRTWIEPILYPWGICIICDIRVATSYDHLCDICREIREVRDAVEP